MTNKINAFSNIRSVLNLIKELVFLIGAIIIFFVIMNIFGHKEYAFFWTGIVVLFSVLKIYFLVLHTFKKLTVLMVNNHSFNHMLLLFGTIISIIIFSFTMDYLCISEIYANAFSGIQANEPISTRFINLLYFSIVTFTTVGYGDITPVATVAKLITVLEMISAFIMIVFVISKYFRTK